MKTQKYINNIQYLKVEGGLRTKGYYKNSLINKPLVTIITVVYNGDKYLENTIHSVINQSYNNLEYIIVDGGSSDRTVDIIRRYENSIDYWVSEKDDGIYDAMNKGIKLSKGLYIGLINSGDWYNLHAIKTVIDAKASIQNDYTIISGAIDMVSEKGNRLFSVIRDSSILDKKFSLMFLNHPSTFVPLSVYKKLHYYKSKYKIAGDYEFALRCVSNNIDIRFIPDILTNMRLGGISNRISALQYKEIYSILTPYIGTFRSVIQLIMVFVSTASKLFMTSKKKYRRADIKHGKFQTKR